jgi:Asparagine synthase
VVLADLPILPADDATILFNFPVRLDAFGPIENVYAPAMVDSGTQTRNARELKPFELLVRMLALQLDDQPCYVEFSGGCDSSLVLSAALAACRSVGHSDPIPITFRYPELPSTDENDYQTAMLKFLGLKAEIISITTEFDLVGDEAQVGLRQCGVVWPAPAMARSGVMKALRPGLVISGEGGDEVLGPRRIGSLYRAATASKRLKYRSVAGNLVNALGPKAVRMSRVAQRMDLEVPWIREPRAAAYRSEISSALASEPFRPGQFAEHYLARPHVRLGRHQLIAIAARTGHRYLAPLNEPEFVHHFGDVADSGALVDRRAVLRRYFSEHLPPLIVERTDKRYTAPVWFNKPTRDFARHWDGQTALQDVIGDELRKHWLTSDPEFVSGYSVLLVQSVWKATHQ